MNRRTFLQTAAGLTALAATGGCSRRPTLPRVPGELVGASSAAGHRLRDGTFPPAAEELAVEVVVLGGGVAGLAAAHRLTKLGTHDLLLLELEAEAGGHSRSGANSISAYPWGAHYLPLPSGESTEVAEWLEEIGVITGRTPEGAPLFDETMLCADPAERLLVHGAWQEGILPRLDVSAADRTQIDAFLDRMEVWRTTQGSDGRRAFAIPVDRSSRDPAFYALDRITMAQYLADEGWTAEPLRWYVDYCCRDDYGAGIEHVSAWAGIHYFAGRNARAGNASASTVLTWPAGNGWLVDRLRRPIADQVRTGCLVIRARNKPEGGVEVEYLDLKRNRVVRVNARAAVCALPRFVAQRVVAGSPVFSDLTYSPWMVANLSLSHPPRSAEALAWDNVIRGSRSLGYVVATHQSLHSHPRETVITYYQPLDAADPRSEREAALVRTHSSWSDQILGDLTTAHPDLPATVRRLDVCVWGHAMIRPTPGFIWGPTRQRMQAPHGAIVFAHSDMSGVSLFEEAFTRGVHAAQNVRHALRSSP